MRSAGRAMSMGVLVLLAGLLGSGCNQRNGGSTISGSNHGKQDGGSQKGGPNPASGQKSGQQSDPLMSVNGSPSVASDNGTPSATAHVPIAEPGVPAGTMPNLGEQSQREVHYSNPPQPPSAKSQSPQARDVGAKPRPRATRHKKRTAQPGNQQLSPANEAYPAHP